MAEQIIVSGVWLDTALLKALRAVWESETKERYLRANVLHHHGRWLGRPD